MLLHENKLLFNNAVSTSGFIPSNKVERKMVMEGIGE
jgi:hypothetical protein